MKLDSASIDQLYNFVEYMVEWNSVSTVSDQQTGPWPSRPLPSYTSGAMYKFFANI